MKKYIKLTVVVSSLFLMSGCSYKIPSYEVNSNNVGYLKQGNNKLKITVLEPAFKDTGSILCRAAGNVETLDSKTFSAYIAQALEDELKYSGHFDQKSTTELKIKVKKADFSSALGNTNWYIDVEYELNGKTFTVSTTYHDRSSYMADKACNNIAHYFRKAITAHLQKLYGHATFKEALG